MNDQKIPHQPIDTRKRLAIKILGASAATGILSTLPRLSTAATIQKKYPLSKIPAASELEGMLVSIPDVKSETLILKNLTHKNIRIDNFFATNKVTFDGEIVDCNDACVQNAIMVPANQDVLIRFDPRENKLQSSSAGELLNLDRNLYRLPAGTRVVPFAASMKGTSAVLAEKTQPVAA